MILPLVFRAANEKTKKVVPSNRILTRESANLVSINRSAHGVADTAARVNSPKNLRSNPGFLVCDSLLILSA